MTDPINVAGQMVTCSKCNVHYRCTPLSDYYNSTTLTDGECEVCMLAPHGFTPEDVVTFVPESDPDGDVLT